MEARLLEARDEYLSAQGQLAKHDNEAATTRAGTSYASFHVLEETATFLDREITAKRTALAAAQEHEAAAAEREKRATAEERMERKLLAYKEFRQRACNALETLVPQMVDALSEFEAARKECGARLNGHLKLIDHSLSCRIRILHTSDSFLHLIRRNQQLTGAYT